MKQAYRFSGLGQPYEGLTELRSQGPWWTGRIKLVPESLEAPLHWKQPRKVFVNSMSDLFHEDVPNKFIASIFGVMAASPEHSFQVLTKRPERMLTWFKWIGSHRSGLTRELVKQGGAWPKADEYSAESLLCAYSAREVLEPLSKIKWAAWPLPNVWLGVSVEDQNTADERIPILLQTPAAVRWVSAEPLLGPVDLYRGGFSFLERLKSPTGKQYEKLDWIVVGGESGPKARPCDLAWIRSTVKQCREAGVPVFVKQIGARPSADVSELETWSLTKMDANGGLNLQDRKGGAMEEWPKDLRVREYP